jgi:hypothetical protein
MVRAESAHLQLLPSAKFNLFLSLMDNPDVLLNVVFFLDRRTLASCLTVSHQFYAVVGPLLYRDLRVSFWRGLSPLDGISCLSADTTDQSRRRKLELLRYTTSLNLGNHHLHCRPFTDVSLSLPNLRVLRIGSNPYPHSLCAPRGPRCPLFVQLQPIKLVLSPYHPLYPILPNGAGEVLPPSVETVVMIEKPRTGITPWPDLGYTFLSPTHRSHLKTLEIVFVTQGPDVGFTYTSPCPVLGLDCTVSHPRDAFWKNLSRVCSVFEGEIRIVNAGGFEREWLGFGEGDVEGKVEHRVRGMLEKVLEDRGVGWEEVEERLKRIRVVDMREWLKRDWEGVVEPSEVEGWL